MICFLHIVVEGKTEKEFIDEILIPTFSERSIILDARCVVTMLIHKF